MREETNQTNDCKKSWSSINHSILSVVTYLALGRHANNIATNTQCCIFLKHVFFIEHSLLLKFFFLNSLSAVQHENCHTEYEEQCHIAEGETEETHYGNCTLTV